MICCASLQSSARRQRSLVGSLDGYPENVRVLFELCTTCQLKEDKGKRHDPCPSTEVLFSPLPSAPFFGRQTYRMWRASFDLSSIPFRKSTDLIHPKRLHFLPLESFHLRNNKVGDQTFAAFVCRFLGAFFSGLKINYNDRHRVEDFSPVERRHQDTGRRQFLVTDFYTKLHRMTGLPNSEYILALTWTDLYPSEELNFVLGQASHRHKCGTFSFGRFEPKSFDPEIAPDEEAELELDGGIIWKMLRVATHETCHLFRITHCVFFSCSMNASGSITEAVMQPMFLCPVCLRKLQRFLGFDVPKRYQELLGLCEILQEEYPSERLEAAIGWLRRVLQFVGSEVDPVRS